MRVNGSNEVFEPITRMFGIRPVKDHLSELLLLRVFLTSKTLSTSVRSIK